MVGSGFTVTNTLSATIPPARSEMVTVMRNSPTASGTQVKVLVFVDAQPGGKPAYDTERSLTPPEYVATSKTLCPRSSAVGDAANEVIVNGGRTVRGAHPLPP